MRTNINIDDQLMNKAKQLTGFETKKEVVEEAIKLMIRLKEQENVKSLFGKLDWQGDLDDMRKDK